MLAAATCQAASVSIHFQTTVDRLIWLSHGINVSPPSQPFSAGGDAATIPLPEGENSQVNVCILDQGTGNMAIVALPPGTDSVFVNDVDFAAVGEVDVQILGATSGDVTIKSGGSNQVAAVDGNGTAHFYGIQPGSVNWSYEGSAGHSSGSSTLELSRKDPVVVLHANATSTTPLIIGVLAVVVAAAIYFFAARRAKSR